MKTLTAKTIDFQLPTQLACPKPTEDRHLERDEVRLMVSTGTGEVHHSHFTQFDHFLQAGDVLVVNTSATVASALPLALPSGRSGMLHLSNKMNEREWLVEIREIRDNKTERWKNGRIGMAFSLPNGARFVVNRRFYAEERKLDLWIGELQTPLDHDLYLEQHGRPIKYTQLDHPFPLSYYQTYFSFHGGSAEMPSAGRGFTEALVHRLVQKGVVIAPILLHTGVSSLEEDEKPYPEYMEVDPVAAAQVNAAMAAGRRVIAVGTTAIRALESAADAEGVVRPYRGHTELYMESSYRMKVTDGLLTGFHEPKASHLNILQSLAGWSHIESAYAEAISGGYFWHQFGDLHLILA